MRFVIVTGLSGAGKTEATRSLEDFCLLYTSRCV